MICDLICHGATVDSAAVLLFTMPENPSDVAHEWLCSALILGVGDAPFPWQESLRRSRKGDPDFNTRGDWCVKKAGQDKWSGGQPRSGVDDRQRDGRE